MAGKSTAEIAEIICCGEFAMEKRKDPLVGYNFCLRIDGVHDLPCKSVQSFEYENEYEYIREGGLNDYVHIRPKPAGKPHTVQIERYVGTEAVDYLAVGNRYALPMILFVSRKAGDFEAAERVYVFTGCMVVGKTYGKLEAGQAELLLETTTIAYQQLLCMNHF